ncbi:MAG: class D sortase [Chloroflexota bacterium]|nr:class D sortase [Chloroflexota bacterium]
MNLSAHIEKGLWTVALAAAGCSAFFALQGMEYGKLSASVFAAPRAFHGAPAPGQVPPAEFSSAGETQRMGLRTTSPRTTAARTTAARTILGRLEIPALSLSVAILPDDDSASLLKGAGHIRGTAMPGGLGTVGLAAHRDTFFRPLRKIAPKMDIRLADESGTYHYMVDSMEVVTPDKVNVLDIAARPELTLITCFPFDYIGAAPKRFIVHAHLLSASPEPLAPEPLP